MKLVWVINAIKKYGFAIEWNRSHFVVTKDGHCLAMDATCTRAIRSAITNYKEENVDA